MYLILNNEGSILMKTSNLKIDKFKVQLLMANLKLNPYDLCSRATISYASYRRIMSCGNCKLSTLGKLAEALECNVTDIIGKDE